MDRPKEFPPVPYRDLLPIGTRVRVTKPTDGAGRWKHGDIGVLVENDFAKYDYCVRFLDAACPVVYFFGGEIEPVEPEPVKIPKLRLKVIPPPCLSCGKPLRRYAFRREALEREILKLRTKLDEAERDGKPRYAVTRDLETTVDMLLRTKPEAQWGSHGDNCFCGVNCACKWALAQVRLWGPDKLEWIRALTRDAHQREKGAAG